MKSILFDAIAFDADDTLWHNERLYSGAQEKLKRILSHYQNPEEIEERLNQTEIRNLEHFGYGVKAYALSMIETAVELTDGRISGWDIQAIIGMAKEMLSADVELLEHAASTIARLAEIYPLMVITKGELRDQEMKVTRSGLSSYFKHVGVVSDKASRNYAALLRQYAIDPQRFMMVGNSLRSDILPVLELGGWAVYIPYPATWSHEMAEPPPPGQPRYYEIEHLGLLPSLLAQLEQSGPGDDFI